HRGHADRVVHLELAGDDPDPLRIQLLGGDLALAQIAGAEYHPEAEQGELAAHLATDAAVTAGHHGHRHVKGHVHHQHLLGSRRLSSELRLQTRSSDREGKSRLTSPEMSVQYRT